MDKRIAENIRVRKSIEDAFFSLLKENSFSEITATQIIQVSGVARTSYYRNFSRKEDIVISYIERQMQELSERISFSETVRDLLIRDKLEVCLAHYLKCSHNILLIYKNGFGTYILESTNRFAEEHLGDMPRNSTERYKLYFLAGALFNMTIQWLLEGAKESPYEMAKVFLQLMNSSVQDNFN